MNKVLRVISYIILVLVIIISCLFLIMKSKEIERKNLLVSQIETVKEEKEKKEEEKKQEEELILLEDISEEEGTELKNSFTGEYAVIIDGLPIYESVDSIGEEPIYTLDYGDTIDLIGTEGDIAVVRGFGDDHDQEGCTLLDGLVVDFDAKYQDRKIMIIDINDSEDNDDSREIKVSDFLADLEDPLKEELDNRGFIPVIIHSGFVTSDHEKLSNLFKAVNPNLFIRLEISLDEEKEGCFVRYVSNDNEKGKDLGEILLNEYSSQTKVEMVGDEKKRVMPSADFEELNTQTFPAIILYLGCWMNDDDYNKMVDVSQDLPDIDVINGVANGIQKCESANMEDISTDDSSDAADEIKDEEDSEDDDSSLISFDD